MKYEFIRKHRSKHRVKKMCQVLKINESGYYRWKRRQPSLRELAEQKTLRAIRKIHEKYHQTYGADKIQRELARQGILCGKSQIYRLMRTNGIYTIHRCKHRPFPKEAIEPRYSENLLNQQFAVSSPNEVWAGDITYIRTKEGWVYLAAVLDLFNKEVVGYALSHKANAELVRRAMDQVLLNRNQPKNVAFHSDRGTQYSCQSYQNYLTEHDIISSMSRKGNPYDNACCESLFATLKKEWIYYRKFANIKMVESSIFEYVELFYNRKRMHTALNYLSPYQYMEKFMSTQAK